MTQQSRQNTPSKPGPAAPQAPPEPESKLDEASEPQAPPEPESKPDEASEPEAPQGHVVLVDMLTYKVKGRKPHTVVSGRTRKGGLVFLDPDLNDIEKLESLKAISLDDGKAKRRTNAKALTAAIGGLDDPVKVPDNLFDVTDEDVTPAEASDDEELDTTSTPADDD